MRCGAAFPFRGDIASKRNVIDNTRYFAWHGGPTGAAPVVLAVPHAGRDYPAPLLAQARVPVAVLRGLEDRYADRLVARAAARSHPVLVATAPRALVDLNRDPGDRDDRRLRSLTGGRAESGMGVFPRRAAHAGELWRQAFDSRDLDERIARIHRPYHAALADALAEARFRCGAAALLDIHSMPRHAGRGWPPSADIVLGDRRGSSAAGPVVRMAQDIVRATGLSCARNTPYAGGYATHCHGDPGNHVHAIQVEIARDLYLDAEGALQGAGVDRIAGLIAAIAEAIAAALSRRSRIEAAE